MNTYNIIDEIKDVEIKESEDLFCQIIENKRILIELQKAKVKYFWDRASNQDNF